MFMKRRAHKQPGNLVCLFCMDKNRDGMKFIAKFSFGPFCSIRASDKLLDQQREVMQSPIGC